MKRKSNFAVLVFKKDEFNQWWLDGQIPNLPGNTTPRSLKPLCLRAGETIILKRMTLLVDAQERYAYFKCNFFVRGDDWLEALRVKDIARCEVEPVC